ncbi:hypothetical protein [Amycolatopsis minnesotensis]|uniref:Uncharacterized protein n=1 Tax=Amycolatopsis minnesotensis TaxID=337894 RepID=A0ABN2R2L6_9PSEU
MTRLPSLVTLATGLLLAVTLFRAVLNDRLLSTKVALTRPDGMIYATACPALILIGLRRDVLRRSVHKGLFSTVAFGLPLGAYLIWRLEFGQWVAYAGSLAVLLFAVLVTRMSARTGLVALLVVTLIPSGDAFARAADRFRAAPTFPMCFVADRIGQVFNRYADLHGLGRASPLAPDLGGSAMTSRLDIVHMAGLAAAKIARLIRRGCARRRSTRR